MTPKASPLKELYHNTRAACYFFLNKLQTVMNIDIMRVQVLALSITIMTACHKPQPQLSIDADNTPYDGE